MNPARCHHRPQRPAWPPVAGGVRGARDPRAGHARGRHHRAGDAAADRRFRPDLILHAAAYTDVDGCETNPDLAFRVNAVGTQNVALAAAQTGAALLYISTNEVFDGSRRDLYREWDVVNPTSVYARSKAAGEEIVRRPGRRPFYICRVAWLFGPRRNNFVTKILAGAEKTARSGSPRTSSATRPTRPTWRRPSSGWLPPANSASTT